MAQGGRQALRETKRKAKRLGSCGQFRGEAKAAGTLVGVLDRCAVAGSRRAAAVGDPRRRLYGGIWFSRLLGVERPVAQVFPLPVFMRDAKAAVSRCQALPHAEIAKRQQLWRSCLVNDRNGGMSGALRSSVLPALRQMRGSLQMAARAQGVRSRLSSAVAEDAKSPLPETSRPGGKLRG